MKKVVKKVRLISVFFFLYSFTFSVAQNPSDTVELLDEVTISATKSPVGIAQLPYAVVVRKKNAMESPLSRTVPEALQGVTGLFIQKTNHGGGSPFLRGLTGNQTLIMVDGVRLNNSIFRYGPNQYMTLIDPSMVERVDVVKGAGSVLYGSDAMTGVICIQSRSAGFSAQPQWKGSSQLRWTSSNMEWTFRPTVEYSGKRFSLNASGGSSRFGDLLGGDTTGFQRPSGYRQGSFDIKLLYDLGKQWIATVSSQWMKQVDVPVYHKYVLENFAVQDSDPLRRNLSYLKISKSLRDGLLRRIDFIFSSQQMGEIRFSRKNSAITTRREEDRINTVGMSADLSFHFTHFWKSNSGFDFYLDKVMSLRDDLDLSGRTISTLRGLYPNGARYLNASVYSFHHFDFKRLKLEAGVRQTFYRATIKDTTLGKVIYKPKALVMQAGLSYRLLSRVYLFAHVSEGFRAANIDDLGTLGIVDFRYEIPSYDLRPERSLNQELGLKYRSPKISGTISLFRVKLFDLITRIKTGAAIAGYDVYTKINIENGFIRGYEADISMQLYGPFRLFAGASYLYGQSISRNEPLRRIPPFYSHISLNYTKKRITGAVHIDHAGKQTRLAQGDRDDNRIPKGGTPGFTAVHLEGGIKLARFDLRLFFHNLFNADYRMHGSGINAMGRALSLNAKYYFLGR
jgi:outer membrane receptor protein involved in Fe transport